MLHKLLSLLKYYSRSKTIFDVHSPYLYQILRFSDDRKRYYYDFDAIENVRDELLKRDTKILRNDYGAGSKALNIHTSIAKIASTSLSSYSQLSFLYRLCLLLQPGRILELGTSLGISASYLASHNSDCVITTVEADEEIYNIALNTFGKLKLDNIQAYNMTFEQYFETESEEFDCAFIDGDHTKESTLRNAKHILPKLNRRGFLVVDDIHWSRGMEKAWEEIKKMPEVRASIDFYTMGIVFLNRDIIHDKHFSYISYKYKPWRAGFFS